MQEDLQIRRYSPTTIRIYLHAMAEFARHFGKAPDRLGAEHIRQYQLFLIQEKKVSQPTVVQMVCALRFFYTHTLNRKIPMERIPFPRRERKLPLILSREEVKALLEAPSDLRHRTLLAILYGCGLRVSELAELKVSDIDSARNVLQTAGASALLLATQAAHRLAVPQHRFHPAHLSQSRLSDVPKGRTDSRHLQTHSSPLAAACVRYAPARSRRQPAHHSDPFGPRPPGDHRALLARRRCSRSFYNQSAGFA